MTVGLAATIAYGILAAVGGVVGYLQARSQISLLTGCGSGGLLLISALGQWQGQAWGLPTAVGITAILLVVFALRWLKTRKFMPAGLMLLLGLPTLGLMMHQLITF